MRVVQVFGWPSCLFPSTWSLCRHAGGKEQQRGRLDQFYAQHWKQHGNVDGNHPDCPPVAGSPNLLDGPCRPRAARLPKPRQLWRPALPFRDLTPNWAARKAYGLLYQRLIGQASTLAYIDTYAVLAVGAAIMFLLSFALRRNELGGGRVVVE